MKVSAEQIAWAAGLFEGEGYFSLTKNRKRCYLSAGMHTTDRDVLERFAGVVGAGNVIERSVRPRKEHWKPQYAWTVSGSKAEQVADLLEPFLGQRRSARLAEIRGIVKAAAITPRPCACCGREFTPARYRDIQRFCTLQCTYRAKYLRRKYGTELESEYERIRSAA